MSETNGKGTTEPPKVVKVAQPQDVDSVEVLGAPPPASISESELRAQIDVAKRYPRNEKLFLKEAIAMVTLTEEIAESCIYSLSRGGDNIAGKSVRLAEICLSAWGNCHAGARAISEDQRYVTSQGVCWDVQRNVRITMETRRRITKSNGQRYGEDMIATTTGAAGSIALRNAILRVIPSAYTDEVYRAAKACAVGEGEGAASRRAKVLLKLAKMGTTTERILAVLKRTKVEDVTLEDVEILIGFGTAIKDGEKTVDELFPPLAQAAVPTAGAAQPQVNQAAEAASAPTTNLPQKEAATVKPVTMAESPAAEGNGGGRRDPAPSWPSVAATVKPISTGKPKQATLADVAARGKPAKGSADVISAPPPRELTFEEQEAANRKAAEPDPDEMPPWAGR